MIRELALAFQLGPAEAATLRGAAPWRGLGAGRATTRTVTLTWFDTPDQALRDRYISLCVEAAGTRRRERVEMVGLRLAAAAEHLAWEAPLRSEAPTLATPRDERLRSYLDGLEEAPLAPVYRAEIKRTSRRLSTADGTIVDAILEEGGIVAQGSPREVCRLVLRAAPEMASGLFALARHIAVEWKLPLATRSLADRARDLVANQPPGWTRRRPSDLGPDSTVEQAMASMVRQGFDHILANQASVLESDDPEGIHQMRVGLRRTRSALRLFRKLLPAAQYDWLTAEIKWATAQLGPARDMDVFEDELVAPAVAGAGDHAAFKALAGRIRAERTRRRRAARRALESARWRIFVLEVGGWLTGQAWRVAWGPDLPDKLLSPIGDLAARQLARRHRQIHRDGRRFHELTPEERHQLRIDVKKLRYALDFFGPLYAERRVTRYLERLAGLQDGLGYLNDVTVARRLIDGLCAGCKGETLVRCLLAGGLILGWHAHGAVAREDQLKADLAVFLRAKPFWNS
ncbi:MAG: CHAD domain-containing protein [Magnetospirillum sp. WYHS-4]